MNESMPPPGTAQPASPIAHTYLFALQDGGGTVPPELGVARQLVDHGHHVTVPAEESMSDEASSTAAAFIPWTQSRGQFQDRELHTRASQLRGIVDRMFVGPAPAAAREDAASALGRRIDQNAGHGRLVAELESIVTPSTTA